MFVGRESNLTRRQGGFRICTALKHWSSLLDQYAPNAWSLAKGSYKDALLSACLFGFEDK